MNGTIGLLYLVVFLGLSAVGLYVCYHIFRYSLSKSRATAAALLFSSVFLFLLLTNAVAFFRIDWDETIRNVGAVPTGSSALFPF